MKNRESGIPNRAATLAYSLSLSLAEAATAAREGPNRARASGRAISLSLSLRARAAQARVEPLSYLSRTRPILRSHAPGLLGARNR